MSIGIFVFQIQIRQLQRTSRPEQPTVIALVALLGRPVLPGVSQVRSALSDSDLVTVSPRSRSSH